MMTQNYSVRRHVGPVQPVRARGMIDRALAFVSTRVSGAWTRHRDEKLLQTLSDHQLRDLGIGRGDIARVIRHGRGW